MTEPRAAATTTSGAPPSVRPPVAGRLGAAFARVRPGGVGRRLAWLVVLLAVCGTVSVFHGADAMWDLKNYHLYIPFEAHHGRYAFDVGVGQVQSYLNPLLDYPFYIAVSLLNDHPRVVAFLMGLPQGVNLWLIGLLAWRLSPARSRAVRRVATGIAVLIGGTGAGTVPLIGSTTGDILVAVPTLASLVALLHGVDRAGRPDAPPHRSLLIAGFLSGAAVGAKPTMACYTVGFAAALLVALPLRDRPGALARFAGTAFLGALATGGYHAVRMFRLFGSPLFPLYNDVFRSPFFEPAAPRDAKFLPKTVLDALSYPFGWATDASRTFVSEVPFRDVRIALELGLIALVAAAAAWAAAARRGTRRPPPRPVAALFVFVAASYAVWLALFAVYRYLLPLEMLSGVMVMAAAAYLAPPAALLPLMAAAAVGCWATTIPLEWGHTAFRDHYVEVRAPALAAGTLVLVVGDDPVSFLVPFMDPGARWLSLDNNFLNPWQTNGLVGREHRIVADHRGPMAVLAESVDRARVASVLSAYGLAADPAGCGKVDSNLGGQSYQLCPVHRAAP